MDATQISSNSNHAALGPVIGEPPSARSPSAARLPRFGAVERELPPPMHAPSRKIGAHGFDRGEVVEIVLRAFAGFIFAFYAASDFIGAAQHLDRLDFAAPDLSILVEMASLFSLGTFMLLIAWLALVRLRPVAKSAGLMPRIAAFFGTTMPMIMGLLPMNTNLSDAGKLISSALVLGGTVLALCILFRLGRSFSFMPEARRLVTTGAYRHVRHPLYLAEFICFCGVLIRFWSLSAALFVGVQAAFQIIRIHYEEQVLRRAFPDYAAYSKKTWRLVPGLY